MKLFLVCTAVALGTTPALAQSSRIPTPSKAIPRPTRASQVRPTLVTSNLLPPPSNDSCATPIVLSGTGLFPFDNSTATTGTQGQAEALCNLTSAGTAILYDVWYQWTAPTSGSARLSSCVSNLVDTKIAVYSGAGCPTSGSAIACNDDGCGSPYSSIVEWPAVGGTTYTIQLGCYPGMFPTATPGAATMQLDLVLPPTNDDCSTPIAIAGYGVTAYDSTAATTGTQGQSEALCNLNGGTGIAKDVWYTWTAPATTLVRVRTCGSGFDTKIAVYAGAGCPTSGSAIACDDDGCGFESAADFQANAGAQYTLQIGLNYAQTSGGPASFEILDAAPPSNDSCATPIVIAGAGPFAYDTSFATTGAEGQSEATCLYYGSTTVANDVWFTWTPSTSGTVTVSTCNGAGVGASEDTKIAAYLGAGCPTTAAVACNDDDGACGVFGYPSTITFNVTCGQPYTLQIGRYPYEINPVYGMFTVTENGTPCNPGTPFCFGDGSPGAGTCPCSNNGAAGNGCASSVNPSGANLAGTGSASLSADTFTLQGSGMTNSTCLYFQGTTELNAGAGVAFGDGLRCAGGTVRRLGTKANVAGASQYPAAGDASVSVKGTITSPGLRTYQVWYRNPASFCTPSTFNLSNGVAVTWGA